MMFDLLIAALVWAPCQVLMHEAAHAITVNLVGGQVLQFKPWPHRYGGRFYFGRVRYRAEPEHRPSIAAAPFLWNGGWVVIMLICYLLTGWKPFLILGVWALVDIMWGTSKRFWRETSDVHKFGMSRGEAKLALVACGVDLACMVVLLILG